MTLPSRSIGLAAALAPIVPSAAHPDPEGPMGRLMPVWRGGSTDGEAATRLNQP